MVFKNKHKEPPNNSNLIHEIFDSDNNFNFVCVSTNNTSEIKQKLDENCSVTKQDEPGPIVGSEVNPSLSLFPENLDSVINSNLECGSASTFGIALKLDENCTVTKQDKPRPIDCSKVNPNLSLFPENLVSVITSNLECGSTSNFGVALNPVASTSNVTHPGPVRPKRRTNVHKFTDLKHTDYEDESDLDISSDESEFQPNESSQSESSSSEDVSSNHDLHPVLEGMQEHPERTDKTRKRKKEPEKWKRNQTKYLRAHGQEYIGTRGIIKAKTEIGSPCKSKCRLKCNLKMTLENRKKLFTSYWLLGNYERQRDFIHSNTDKMPTKTKTTLSASRRNFSSLFYLPINGIRERVCKKMFLSTLGIKKGVVDIALKKRSSVNTCLGDKRGKHVKKNLSGELQEGIKVYIESFPVVPSHYARSDTERKYLAPELNIQVMYRLYIKYCDEKKISICKESAYRNIFNNDYNLGFHQPKKDQCRLCVAFEKNEFPASEHKEHLMKTNLAREEKKKDKEIAEFSKGKVVCINFDLQQVLMVPNDPTNNALFYKRRLATYNFTVYDVISKEGSCFMWHEGEGGRGSCDIASCLYKYFEGLSQKGVESVCCFSDRCGGQNLNQFVACMCMHAVVNLQLKTIEPKFLTSGHSEMECDSIHSAIGTEFKRVGKAYWPGDWKTIARSARKKGDKPYREIDNIDFFDWKKFAQTNFIIRKKNENGHLVHWQKMCAIKFEKDNPSKFKYKESFNDSKYHVVDCTTNTRRSSHQTLQSLYDTPRSITKSKYNDLLSLFTTKPPAINRDYYNFYANLLTSSSAVEDE